MSCKQNCKQKSCIPPKFSQSSSHLLLHVLWLQTSLFLTFRVFFFLGGGSNNPTRHLERLQAECAPRQTKLAKPTLQMSLSTNFSPNIPQFSGSILSLVLTGRRPKRPEIPGWVRGGGKISIGLRTLFPLTAFKNAPNPKFCPKFVPTIFFGVAIRGFQICREVLNGVGADGVGVKIPIFPVNCSYLPLS